MSTFDKVIFSDAQNCLQIKRDHKMIENHSGGEEKIGLVKIQTDYLENRTLNYSRYNFCDIDLLRRHYLRVIPIRLINVS